MSEQTERQKKEQNRYTLGKHFTLHRFVTKKSTLAVALAICLLIILIEASRFEPSILANRRKTALYKELSFLSEEENEKLKELFDYHFFFSDFAYTLFGTKPMSIGRLLPTQEARQGWEAWEKVHGFFDSKDFVIRKYACNNCEFILVANLRKVEQIYYQHRQYFDQTFRGQMTLEALVFSLREGGPLFQELMQNHLLVGILLGYGVHNAELFAMNQGLLEERRIPLRTSSWTMHPILYVFSEVMPVSFACDPSTDETKELKRRYTEERRAILKLAKKDPLFFQMLAKLSGSDQREHATQGAEARVPTCCPKKDL